VMDLKNLAIGTTTLEIMNEYGILTSSDFISKLSVLKRKGFIYKYRRIMPRHLNEVILALFQKNLLSEEDYKKYYISL